ncbi:hypothetical protein AAFC00_005529 [Neodothiora populina]|uniref:Zn(2)-C6 fungal-type domain-containing protein n=1 Tax=Neodothiora populina TaxID=2781224 RepID=A0ABR3PL73_9PEZI
MFQSFSGAESTSSKIRCSQRVPRSCIRCSKKRIKCDKNIPCQTCIARGLETSCTRETVRVKGKIISGVTGKPDSLSYSDLLEENRRLKLALQTNTQAPTELVDPSWVLGGSPTITEAFENYVHPADLNAKRPSAVSSPNDVFIPTRGCSKYLVEHGIVWTSWIHFAVHVPTFRREHEMYWSNTQSALHTDPSWLAIYYGFLAVTLLFLDEQEAVMAGLPHDHVATVLENWYEASICYLNRADFMRQHNMRTVQTIAILLGLYKGMGDFGLHSTHLASGLRIAQNLHLDSDSHHMSASILDNEVRRRVWWTLVICEWLQRPLGLPLVRQTDFDVALPLDIDDEELEGQSPLPCDHSPRRPRPRAVQYHLAMIAISKLWHGFRTSLTTARHSPDELEALVLHSDEALANIIADLPIHLQEDSPSHSPDHPSTRPWLSWQRNNLSMTILYYRMAINRVLQDQWVQKPNSHARTQAICVGSAQAIVSLVDDRYTAASARHRPWAIASNLFSAAITLVVEARFADPRASAGYVDDVRRCVDFLSVTKDRNVVAARAVEVLGNCLVGLAQPQPFLYVPRDMDIFYPLSLSAASSPASSELVSSSSTSTTRATTFSAGPAMG